MADHPPECPHCRRPMYLVRVIPGVAGHPELHSFACRTCREATTREADSDTADRGRA